MADDIFISYSRKDSEFVRTLHAALEAREREAWVDWEDIPPAWDWREELNAGIERAGAFVFVISPDSLRSDVCGQELEQALAGGKKIVPVLLQEPDGVPVPAELANRNYVFLRNDEEFPGEFERLLKALDTDIEWVREHTRLLVRASEWNRGERKDGSLLLRGGDLTRAESALTAWREGTEPAPTRLQQEYVAASRRASARRTRTLLGAAGVALAISIVLGVLALIQRERAEDRERSARSRALAVQALQQGDANPDRSLRLALDAVELDRTTEAEEALRLALSRLQSRGVLRVSGKPVTSVAIHSRERVVAGTEDGVARVWDSWSGRTRDLGRQQGALVGVTLDRDGKRVLLATDAGAQVAQLDARESVPIRAPGLRAAGLSLDGEAVVGLVGPRTVRRWDARTGRPTGRPMRAPSEINDASTDVAGEFVLVAAEGGRALLFDADTGEVARRWLIPEDSAFRTSLAQSAAFGVGVSEAARTPFVWDTVSGRAAALFGHELPPRAVAISPFNNQIATAGTDNTARIWSAKTRRTLRVLRGHTDAVDGVAFSEDGRRVLTLSQGDETARVWSAKTGEQLAVLRGFGGNLNDAGFTDDGRYVVTGGGDGMVRLWEASPGRTLAELEHDAPVEAAALDPKGRLVASSSGAGLEYARAADGDVVEDYTPDTFTEGATTDLAFDPKGGRLAVADGAAAFVVDVKTGDNAWLNHEGAVRSVAWTRDGARVVTASDDGTARLLDPADPDPAKTVIRAPGPLVRALPTPDGRRIVTLEEQEGTARLWDVATGKELDSVTGLGTGFTLAMSPDGKAVALGGTNTAAFLWRPGPGVGAKSLEHNGAVLATRFSRDGRLLATGSIDGTARVWDVGTGRELHTFRRHLARVNDVDFSPDGRFLLSAGGDRQALIWDLTIGRVVAEFGGHDGPVLKARFSTDGTKVLTVPEKGSAAVYACDACGSLDDVVERARRLLGRGS